MHFNRFILTSMITASLLTGCGAGSKVTLKGVDVSTREVGQKTYVDLDAIVTLGNLKLPDIEVPILNPSNLSASLGQLAMQHLDDGSNLIKIELDYEETTHLNATLGQTLPNDREIPASVNLAKNTLVGVPVLEKSRVYLGGDLRKDLFIGIAVSIPALDSIMNQNPLALNLFYPFPFSPEVTGNAGIYSSPNPGMSGMALFVKRSAPVIPPAGSSFKIASPSQTVLSSPALPEDAKQLSPFTWLKLDRLFRKHFILKVR